MHLPSSIVIRQSMTVKKAMKAATLEDVYMGPLSPVASSIVVIVIESSGRPTQMLASHPKV